MDSSVTQRVNLRVRAARPRSLYSPEERLRRDRSAWTVVQGVLAPLQLLVCAGSTLLVVRALETGAGQELALASVVVKTFLLYAIMVTGSIWEREVFGRWLFAAPFWWEDLVSLVVLALHTLYLAALVGGWWSVDTRLQLALVAYAAYAINAAQFLAKLRMARREARAEALP